MIGHSGHRDEREEVDRWSHFVNSFMLDRNGNRINRRNAQDIFTPLYTHQIPPGAGQTIHYQLAVPSDDKRPIEITARLLYRKFDTEYLDYVRRDRDPARDKLDLGKPGDPNDLPIIEIASDRIILKIGDETANDTANTQLTDNDKAIPEWQRWNDYGIGLLLKGQAESRQAADAFQQVESFGRFDGPLNYARTQFAEGDLNGATESLRRAASMDPPPPSWTHGWLSGVVNRQQGNFDAAVDSLRGVLATKIPERGFDFSLDYAVRNELGLALIDVAQRAQAKGDQATYQSTLEEAKTEFETVLETDSENVTAHWNLAKIYASLGDTEREAYHRELHSRYKLDDNASELAIPAARRKYPAANHAATGLVIYDLQRENSAPNAGNAGNTEDASNTQDTGNTDAGNTDAGNTDAGNADAGNTDEPSQLTPSTP